MNLFEELAVQGNPQVFLLGVDAGLNRVIAELESKKSPDPVDTEYSLSNVITISEAIAIVRQLK